MTYGADSMDSAALIRRAGESVEVALGDWNAVQLDSLGRCVLALEASASDLRAAMDLLSLDPAGTPRGLRENVLRLKQNLVRLSRLSGASQAFLRNLPGSNSGSGELYQPGGGLRSGAIPQTSYIEV